MTARATSVDRCDYCGLPLAAPPIPRESPTPPPVAPPAEALYCCYGCRFAAAVTREKGEAGHARLLMIRLGLAIFFRLDVTVFTMARWTTSVYERAPTDTSPLAGALDGLFRYASLLFALPVMLLLGGPLVESALSDLRRRVASTDPLLLSGVAASFLYSVISVVRGEGHVYFEVGCVVLLAVTLVRWL